MILQTIGYLTSGRVTSNDDDPGFSFYTDICGASRSNRLFRAGRARPLARGRMVVESTGAYTSALTVYVARLTLLFAWLRLPDSL